MHCSFPLAFSAFLNLQNSYYENQNTQKFTALLQTIIYTFRQKTRSSIHVEKSQHIEEPLELKNYTTRETVVTEVWSLRSVQICRTLDPERMLSFNVNL